MAFARHAHLYGTTEEQLGWVAVTERAYARLNPLAIFRDPLTIEDYLAQPYLVEPLRRADVCMISDGGACLIVTSADRASATRTAPVYLLGDGAGHGAAPVPEPRQPAPALGGADGCAGLRARRRAPRGRRRAVRPGPGQRLGPARCSSSSATAAPASRALRRRGPHPASAESIPVNTNGGQLSESYMWGWLHLCEAVRQLRGECGAPPGRRRPIRAVLLDQGLREGGDVDPRHRGADVTALRGTARERRRAARSGGPAPRRRARAEESSPRRGSQLPALRRLRLRAATPPRRCCPECLGHRSHWQPDDGRRARSGATASITAPSTRRSASACRTTSRSSSSTRGPRLISNVLDVEARRAARRPPRRRAAAARCAPAATSSTSPPPARRRRERGALDVTGAVVRTALARRLDDAAVRAPRARAEARRSSTSSACCVAGSRTRRARGWRQRGRTSRAAAPGPPSSSGRRCGRRRRSPPSPTAQPGTRSTSTTSRCG